MLETFKATLGKRGFAKPTMFRVEINSIPNEMTSLRGIHDIHADLHYFAESAEFPGTQILTQELRHYDMPAKFAYLKAHDDLNLVFRLDRDFQIKKFFDVWVNSIYDRTTGNMNYKKDYVGGIQVFQIMENGAVSYGIELEDAFPTQVGQISLGWDQSGQYSRLPVTFSFRRMKSIATVERFYGPPQFGKASSQSGDSNVLQSTNMIGGEKTMSGDFDPKTQFMDILKNQYADQLVSHATTKLGFSLDSLDVYNRFAF